MAKKNRRQQNDNSLPIIDLLYLCIGNWHWYAVSLFVTLTIAVLYILMTPPVYVSHVSLLIKDDSNTRTSSSNSFTAFSDNHRSNAEEELRAMRSPAIMTEVIKRLNLDVCYTGEGRFHDPVIYGQGLPAKVKLLDLNKNDDAGFTMNLQEDGTLCMWGFMKNGFQYDGFKRATDGDTIESPIGRIAVTFTENAEYNRNKNIQVTRTCINKTIENFYSRFSASFENKNTTIANLHIKDVSTYRGRDILGTMIEIYNERWMADKNQIAISTDSFLNERILLLQQELWQLDGQAASYSTGNAQNIKSDDGSILSEIKEAEKQILSLNNQREVVQYLINILREEKKLLLPGNIGLENVDIKSLVTDYNQAMLRRNAIAQNSSDDNPLVKEYDSRLEKLKKSIIAAANNEIESLNSQIRLIRKTEVKNDQALATSPELAKKKQNIERQLKVKNSLYLFLLQKREENELSKEYTASNTRIISAPSSSYIPIAPLKKNAVMMALAIGLLLPTAIIFFKEISNNKIRGRKDLEGIDIPFVGEIPMHIPEDRKEARKAMRGEGAKTILVKHGSRDIINEAFRVLRTNLQFIAKQKEGCNVVVLTSFNPGSGKTFLTMNIAASLSLKGERVLVIDGDMRHGSTSAYISSPKTGISNYLSKEINDVSTAIVEYEGYENLHILPVGTIPPNPTELLHEKRFGELINELRNQYSYILIDCPPVDIVADTQIIEYFADRTLFVVRTGLLARNMLDELENIHEEKRLKNLAIILNGTYSHGGYYKYGYRYGYRYSYRYGYRYGYHGDKKGIKGKKK